MRLSVILFTALYLCVVGQRRQRIIEGNSKVTYDLLNLLQDGTNNVFFSPLSLEQAIGMVYMGSSGKTAGQIKHEFLLEGNKQKACIRFKRVSESLGRLKDATLEMANRIFLGENFILLSEYQRHMSDCFHSQAENVDFSQSEETAQKINSWVEEVTHEKIKNLISSSDLTPTTRMVLVNGIYFKGEWVRQFQGSSTYPFDFHLSKNASTIKVDMMNQDGDMKYAQINELGAQVLEMPYKGNRISMLVVLPNENEGLDDFVPKLRSVSLEKLISQLEDTLVRVRFPKFRMETDMKLNDPLKRMGIKDMFSEDADLSLMTASEALQVSFVVQKAFLECNEKGTEAAAATGVGVVGRSGPIYPRNTPKFYADHPFVFFILDKKSGIVLFSGRLENPTQDVCGLPLFDKVTAGYVPGKR